jgi:hypothetical protein
MVLFWTSVLRDLRQRSRGCAQTSRASSPHAVGFGLQPGQAESGHRFFTVGSVGSTVAICRDTLVSGADALPLWLGAGLLEAATVYRETTAGVACTPKLCAALRLKTCEARPDARYGPVRGKAVFIGDLFPLVSAPLSADHGSLVLVGSSLRGTIWRPGNGNASVAVTSTTSNDSVRDSLPDQIENSLLISSQNHQSLNTVWK